MSIADKITQLTTIRGDIRTALSGKGVSASDHDYADFATDIAAIPSGGGDPDGYIPIQNVTVLLEPSTSLSVKATGMAYNHEITYYTDSACTTEADMSGYSDNDTITDTVYFLV